MNQSTLFISPEYHNLDPDRPMRVEYDKKRFQENAVKGKKLMKSLRNRQSDK